MCFLIQNVNQIQKIKSLFNNVKLILISEPLFITETKCTAAFRRVQARKRLRTAALNSFDR